MSVIKGSALVLSVVLTGALVSASSPESSSGATATPAIRLKTISSRVTSKGTSLVIEATEPVPYVATRPDPLTLLIDFRNVAADAVISSVAPDEKSAIESVAVEQASDAAGRRAIADWVDRIRSKVRSNVIEPPDLPGNPECVFEVILLPTYEVLEVRLKRSSGNRAYDDAVQRAILKSSPLPRPDRADVFQRTLELRVRPRD